MNDLVSNAQSAFIKSRSIQDNFMFVRNYVCWLHRRKKPPLLLNLDIKKAVYFVRWNYIFDLLQTCGSPPEVPQLDCRPSLDKTSRVLLNGVPEEPISHGHGLRQVEPFSRCSSSSSSTTPASASVGHRTGTPPRLGREG